MVDLSGLVSLRGQTKKRSDIARSAEAAWILDGSSEGQSRDRPDSRYGHQQPAGTAGARDPRELTVERPPPVTQTAQRGEQGLEDVGDKSDRPASPAGRRGRKRRPFQSRR